MAIQQSIFSPAWTLASAATWGAQVAKLAGYEAGQPSRTFTQHSRIGSNPNSVFAQIERVRMAWNAESIVKDTSVGSAYTRTRMNYCAPRGWMPNTGDQTLNGEIRAYVDEWMEDGGMNCSAYSAFSRMANVQLPVRGDSALVWQRDEGRLRIAEAGGDQIGELNHYGNPSFKSENGMTYFLGMYFDASGIRRGFRVYSKGTNDHYFQPTDYPSSDVLYFQDNLFGGVRGVTIFHAAIKMILKSEKLYDFGMDAAQKQAKTGVVVRNEQGGPMGELSYDTQQNMDGSVVYIERTFDGAQTEYQYNGDAYEVIKTEMPGDALIKGCEFADGRASLALGFPVSFLLPSENTGGAPLRLEISQAQKEVERLREVQSTQFKRMMYVIIMDAVDRRIFRGSTIQKFSSKQLTKGAAKFPNLPTADAFRETQDDIASNRAGIETRAGILSRTNEDWQEVKEGNKREAMDISRAVQDANRQLQKELSPIDFQPYEGDITAADIAQNSDNPQESATGEAIAQQGIAPNIPGSGKGQVTDNPPNVTRGAFAFDESQHPRGKDGEFGEGSDGKPKAVSEMSPGELKTHKLKKKLESLRSGNAEKSKAATDAVGRVSDLRAAHDKLKEELAKPNPNIDAIKNRVKETEEKLRATELKTRTVEHALRNEDNAADEHGHGSPAHQSAQDRTRYVANMSAYIGDIQAGDLPQSTQNDIANILGTNGTTPKLKLIKYGMVPQELEKMADPHNLESAQRHIRNMPNYACSDDVHQDQEKHVLIQNNKVVDGHHYIAKALKGGVTKSLPVIDLSPARFQGAALKEFDESKHPRASDGEFGSGGGSSVAQPKEKKTKEQKASDSDKRFEDSMKSKNPSDQEAHRAARKDGVAIPPAWTDVVYHGKDKGVIAEGRDEKGRKQRAENPEYRQGISDANNARIAKDLMPRIGEIRDQLKKDALAGNEEAKVLYLITQSGFRIGGKGDGKADVQAFGASNLMGDHVTNDESGAHFDFLGKKGVRQQHSVDDTVIRGFTKDAEKGKALFNTTAEKVRAAWQDKYGGTKVHDIRHVVATELAESELSNRLKDAKPANEKEKKKLMAEVATKVGEKLGNNPSQALSTYIDPAIWHKIKY